MRSEPVMERDMSHRELTSFSRIRISRAQFVTSWDRRFTSVKRVATVSTAAAS